MIVMVGDGINDSFVFVIVDVGIVIGLGLDVVISSVDFVFVKLDFKMVVMLLDLLRVVFRRIKFNFGWVIVYNMVMILVVVGVFYLIVS